MPVPVPHPRIGPSIAPRFDLGSSPAAQDDTEDLPMTDLLREDLRDAEAALLKELRAQRRRIRECWLGDGTPGQLTLGQ